MVKMTASEVQALRVRISRSCRHARASGSPGAALLEAMAESVPWAPGSKDERYTRLEAAMRTFLDWAHYDRTPEERRWAMETDE